MAQQSNVPMLSETSICNQALSWVGQEEVADLQEKSKQGQWCRNNYPFIRDALLEMRLWTFATVRATSNTANKDAWGVMYRHDTPKDWLSVLRCYKNVEPTTPVPDENWVVEEEFILSNYSTIYLYGVKRVTDTGKFSYLFAQALAARLAVDMAIPMTQSRLLQADLQALYKDKLDEATVGDGRQGKMERARARFLERAR